MFSKSQCIYTTIYNSLHISYKGKDEDDKNLKSKCAIIFIIFFKSIPIEKMCTFVLSFSALHLNFSIHGDPNNCWIVIHQIFTINTYLSLVNN